MQDFVHLHLHTEYSLLDGACRIADIPEALKKLNQSAAAITDHMSMSGVIDFYLTCVSQGIKPIIGCEVCVNHKKTGDTGHLILLAENETGYKNLMYLISAAYTESYKGEAELCIDCAMLGERSTGLIVLSGCMSGFICRTLLSGNIDGAADYIREFVEIFGKENFFLELQNHNISEQNVLNRRLSEFAKIYGIGLVATNNVHYINKENAEILKILKCIRENITLDDIGGESYLQSETEEMYLKSTEEMNALFCGKEYIGAVENTLKIAERCNISFDFSQLHLPKYHPPDNFTSQKYLRKLCHAGLDDYIRKQRKNNEEADVYKKRLEYELEIVESMGYVDYYLIVWDFINYAKSKNISVGPGRGSGAGSLAALCIGITDIDPIKYDLLFERFLNPERVSMPDFDIDLCHERRGEVVDYVINKYKGRAAHIITFGTMLARGVVRDVGRILGISHGNIDYIAKLIPQELGITLDKAIEMSENLRFQYENTEYVRNLIDTAKKVEGLPKHTSVHAAGIVITDKPIYEYTPLTVNADNLNTVVTQYAMDAIAEAGLLKIDFLGSRYLTVIDDTVREIQKNNSLRSSDIIPAELNDESVYRLYASGRTDGIFQFESVGMKKLLTSLKPESFEDIVAAIALFRPGPMDSIPIYIKNRLNKSETNYKLPELKPILETTYGCIVYQEQVMQIFRTLAGYSYARADIVRRAMSKKKADIMEREREYFLIGCTENGIDKKIAAEIFDEMAEFANYAFNRSHAVAYAVISYRTAYLKRYYPREFFSALLSSVSNDTLKLDDYVRDCQRAGIKVYPPDINYSEVGFTPDRSGHTNGVRYGLAAIKNIGVDFAKNIVKEREANGEYRSMSDFLNRLGNAKGAFDYDVNKRQTEALIKCGAFDSISGGVQNRAKLIETYGNVIDRVSSMRRQNVTGQTDLFSEQTEKVDTVATTGMTKNNSVVLQNNYNNQEIAEMEILYLKVDDIESKLYRKVLSLTEIFEGRTEVKIYEAKSKKIFVRKDRGVDLNVVFVNELKALLGEDNVKVVKK